MLRKAAASRNDAVLWKNAELGRPQLGQPEGTDFRDSGAPIGPLRQGLIGILQLIWHSTTLDREDTVPNAANASRASSGTQHDLPEQEKSPRPGALSEFS
jgi:hypothetical protein